MVAADAVSRVAAHGADRTAAHGAEDVEKIEIFFHRINKVKMITPPPPPIKLQRQWTSNKMLSLAHKRSVDIGKNILRNIVFTCNPKTIAEIIDEANSRALLQGFTHIQGNRQHRSTVGVHNGRIMERRVYFNSWEIKWLPI